MDHKTFSASLRNTCLVLCGIVTVACGQDGNDPTRKRVQPPKWSPADRAIFFENAFREALSGARPKKFDDSNPSAREVAPTTPVESQNPSGAGWENWISAETLESEIKTLKQQLDSVITTPGKFRSGGNREARLVFSTLAAMMGIVHEFDADVRWKSQAKTARDLFARTAANAKVGTIQAYQEAKLRKADLHDLLSGANLTSKPVVSENWGNVVDRAPVMERMQISQHDRLAGWVSSAPEFHQNKKHIKHEAELIAALGTILTQEGMEDGEDVEYAQFCQSVTKAAADLRSAVSAQDLPLAQKSHGVISKACDACHEIYRE